MTEPLTTKYRPKTFSDIVGQKHIVESLCNMIKADRIPSAFLFAGERGLGKTTTARILSKAMNCPDRKGQDPCNKCQSCIDASKGTSLDISEIDGASNRGVSEIKLVLEPTKHYPAYSRFKITIIDEVHRLSREAFDSMLKLIEEPPPHVKFIFCTTQKYSVPSTIISRASDWDFRLVPHTDMVKYLSTVLTNEKIKFDPKVLELVARQGNGSVRDTLSYLDSLLASCNYSLSEFDAVVDKMGIVRSDVYFNIVIHLLKNEPVKLMELIEACSKEGTPVSVFLDGFTNFLNDLLAIKVGFMSREDLGLSDKDFKMFRMITDKVSLQRIIDTCDSVLTRANEMGTFEQKTMVLRLLFSQLILIWQQGE